MRIVLWIAAAGGEIVEAALGALGEVERLVAQSIQQKQFLPAPRLAGGRGCRMDHSTPPGILETVDHFAVGSVHPASRREAASAVGPGPWLAPTGVPGLPRRAAAMASPSSPGLAPPGLIWQM